MPGRGSDKGQGRRGEKRGGAAKNMCGHGSNLKPIGTSRHGSSVELCFDLVYVFAIGELSDRLLEHVDVRG